MTVPPHDLSGVHAEVSSALAQFAGRLRASCLLRAIAAALALAAAIILVVPMAMRDRRTVACLGAVALLFWLIRVGRSKWTREAAARAVERARPDSRNVVITAEELLRYPGRARPWVRDRVFRDAARILRESDVAAIAPIRGRVGLLVLAFTALVLVLARVPQQGAVALRDVVQRAAANTDPLTGPATLVRATVVPPAYLSLPQQSAVDPERLDGIAGSRVKHTVENASASVRVRFGERLLSTAGAGPGRFSTELTMTENGYIAIEDPSIQDPRGRRLIAVAVAPDRAPIIRIEEPGKDLLLPDTRPTVAVAAAASDDFGLQSLELRYTKVSGSGEQFEFEEGMVPLNITRSSDRAWTAQASLALSRLTLQRGDSVVYRVVGRDARPGDAGLGTSDTFFIEVASPSQVSLAGFELPPDRERYALSQQMIVLKIQRLRSREQTMSRPAVSEEATSIAVEQRAVRNNFIFLTGGHVEDEEEEAAQSSEIQEGRLENTARKEIGIAVQHMSRAEQALVAFDSATAFSAARAAVEALQRAFGRNRYILRTLPVRSRIDPSRRLSGNLDSAGDLRREPYDAPLEPSARMAHRLLARLFDVHRGLAAVGTVDAAPLNALAEEALSVDPSSEQWQRISRGVMKLRDRVAENNRADASATVNELVRLVSAEARRHALPTLGIPDGDPALRSAWAAERRHR